jgi:hypothetical protein
MTRLVRRWELGRVGPPPQAHQEHFLRVVYRALLYATERGSTQDVVELLVDMAA